MEEFNEMIFDCGLVDVDFDGRAFTWTNDVVWQRLDIALINAAWSDLFITTKVSHLMRGHSNHAPFLVKCGNSFYRASSFRFFNVWKKRPNFLTVVQ